MFYRVVLSMQYYCIEVNQVELIKFAGFASVEFAWA